MKASISVSMISKNAADIINRSLQSIQNWVKEIVIVNSFSSDKTLEIAKRFNARIYKHKYQGEGKQRNYALTKAKAIWVLALDADEIITPELKREILRIIKSSRFSGYKIPIQNYFRNKRLNYGKENYYKMVLFKKNKGFSTTHEIHAVYKVKDNKVGVLKNKINHYSYRSLWQLFTKFTSYGVREAKQKKMLGERISLKKILLNPLRMFLSRFIKNQGYKDGLFRIPIDLGFAYMELLTYLLLPIVNKNKDYEKANQTKFKDIVKTYNQYKKQQLTDYCSFESENQKWETGQERYIKKSFCKIPRDFMIADIACGDGIGLRQFKKLGFKNIIGVDFNQKKISIAKKVGYKVVKADMHKLIFFKDNTFDIIYSSHTLEHAFRPAKVIKEFYRIMKIGGMLYVILPYPDTNFLNEEAHGSKYELGLNINDKGKTLKNYFKKYSFECINTQFDSYREPEIWLKFRKE
ncbi:hypothetical protein COW98_01770 [Candidatus Roizmanbacteria bacterium CG22_combo_CG10-13_8_21_14_all_35_9]|uniref:Glycosyltransferase 2-like domain-containing protein n=4 Tax=Candidatus Roizmaniibacteriota TaxID=1752723 RepID=A0A2M8F0W1_9BACT|nr:MAG: hypothetical protein COX47_01720 [Candidatus Roizmanbacteria bacterium CG23_combo_of_CG06-09_8_20_14_all_35_49]PIP62873.1 MAG: hypothetical protein COW98_01770 [Candidatus Roizmanbacteria bacterium CG22_combo_CG10-13_8_21_14_all_35_9]PIY70908.1 MAG: hypothetical protein COY88_03240 [Candidatus Roizmanbacteria bacterium CG_4_10_14_0_8_um_filter_35_28]PJC32924.1 MAG: hypothetical protein CO048_04045 [Candidatus Roizmanbacteria bacterium CG_4_9_14_0_2_um_filter_35_15]PJC82419.1 MAG: hypoth